MHVSACLRLPCPFEWSSTSTLLSINARHASKLTGLPIWLASCGAVARWAFGGAEGGYLPARRPSPCAGTDGAEGDEIRCGRRCGAAAAGGERAPATRTMAACMAWLARTMTTRAERLSERIARLLDQVQSAADTWVQATYACGVEDGRHGLRSVYVAGSARSPSAGSATLPPATAPASGRSPISPATVRWTRSGATSVTASCSRTVPGEAFR